MLGLLMRWFGRRRGEPVQCEVYCGTDGYFHFRIKQAGHTIFNGVEFYQNRQNADQHLLDILHTIQRGNFTVASLKE